MSFIRPRTYNFKAVSETPTPSDLKILGDADYAGADVKGEDLIVRQMLLCHDQYDRTFEKFPIDYLERFAETLPGKSVLPGHDTSQLPLARFFKSQVTEIQERGFPVLVTRERKSAEVVPGFAPKSVKVNYLDAGFYYPATDQDLDAKIKAGVFRSVSIGFRYDDVDCDLCKKSYFSDCPHLAGRWSEDGRLATLTYSGDAKKAEALEGSIVYLGAQPQARIQKIAADMARLGEVDPVALAEIPIFGGIDPVTLKWAEQLARESGHKRKSWSFKAAPAEGVMTDQPEAAAEGTEMLERLRKLFGLAESATEDDVFKAVEAAKGEGEKATALKPLADVGKQAIADLQKSIGDDHRKVAGADSAELVEIVKMLGDQANYKRLKEIADEKALAVLEKIPAGKSGSADIEETTATGSEQPAREYGRVSGSLV